MSEPNERIPGSNDMGKTWTYSASPFQPIAGSQRAVLMRLREGRCCLFHSSAKKYGTRPSGRHDEVGQPAVVPLNTYLGNTIAARRTAAGLGSGFAVLSIILSALGIYGLIAYWVTHCTAEIGVQRQITDGRDTPCVVTESSSLMMGTL